MENLQGSISGSFLQSFSPYGNFPASFQNSEHYRLPGSASTSFPLSFPAIRLTQAEFSIQTWIPRVNLLIYK